MLQDTQGLTTGQRKQPGKSCSLRPEFPDLDHNARRGGVCADEMSTPSITQQAHTLSLGGSSLNKRGARASRGEDRGCGAITQPNLEASAQGLQ